MTHLNLALCRSTMIHLVKISDRTIVLLYINEHVGVTPDIVNMETSRPTLRMIKCETSISHIIRDTDQYCIDIFSKEMFCNIAFGRCDTILKLAATAKQIVIVISTRMYIANNRCTCSVSADHSFIIVNIVIYAIVFMYVFSFLYRLIGSSMLSPVNGKFIFILLKNKNNHCVNKRRYTFKKINHF